MADKTREDTQNLGVRLLTGGASPAQFRIAITGDFEDIAKRAAPWGTLGQDTEVVAFTEPFNSEHQTIRALREFDAITLMHERVAITLEIIEQLPRLKCIVFSGRRNEKLDHQAALARGIAVCRSNPRFDHLDDGPGGRSPSELAVALLMSCTWQTGAATTLIREGGWAFRPGVALRGKTFGVMGYGSVGRPVARFATALGMHVLAFSRSLTEEESEIENVTRTDLESLLHNSDVISIHLPLNASTRRMIGEREIAKMKDGVIVINTARAEIVSEEPFLQALRTKKIAMAGLDVFWDEPLPANHPLKHLSNVVLTPHIGFVTEATMIARYRTLLEVLAAYRQGNVIGSYASDGST